MMEGHEDGQPYEQLPPFAKLNPLLIQLFQLQKQLERDIRDVDAEKDDNSTRLTVMQNHAGDVSQELLRTQQLFDSKQKEIQTEDHLKQLADREAGRMRAEINRINREKQKIEDMVNVTQNNIFRANEVLDQNMAELQMKKEELEQWALAAKQKEEDHGALSKYSTQDAAKIKQMNLDLEKLTLLQLEKKKSVDQEITETQAAQIELDKVAENFRGLHKQRQDLSTQFADAVNLMESRDENIREAGEKFAAQRQELRVKQENVMEHQRFLEDQKSENKKLEAQISVAERNVGKLREQFGTSKAHVQELQDEVEVLKNTMAKAEADLIGKKGNVEALKDQKAELERRLDRQARNLDAMTQRHVAQRDFTGNLEMQAKQMEAYFKGEEQAMIQREKDIEKLKADAFKQSQLLFKERQAEANYMTEISGAQAAAKNMMGNINILDQKSLKQQELLYQQDFQIQQMERKVARASGERTNEEKKVLNARILVLQKELEEKAALHVHLTNQLKRLTDDLRKKQRELTQLKEDKVTTGERINELMLETESVERSVKIITKRKEEMMVQRNMLRLDLKKKRQELNALADEVYAFQNRKEQLKLAMDEREKQISAHCEMLRAQLRLVEQERAKVAMELNERKQKADRLGVKFEVVESRMTGTDDGGEPRSQTYHVIKAAQEKEELTRQGDELNGQIEKVEREIRNMSKMLDTMNGHNETLRKSSHLVDPESMEMQEKADLEVKAQKAREVFRRRKIQRDGSRQDLDQLLSNKQSLESDHADIAKDVAAMEQKGAEVSREISDLLKRCDAAKKNWQKSVREYKKARKIPTGTDSYEEKDMKMQEAREEYKVLVHTLISTVKQFPGNHQDRTQELFEREGLAWPAESRPGTTDDRNVRGSVTSVSSRPPSGNSTARSVRSAASVRSSGVGIGAGPVGPKRGITPRSFDVPF